MSVGGGLVENAHSFEAQTQIKCLYTQVREDGQLRPELSALNHLALNTVGLEFRSYTYIYSGIGTK